MVYLWTFLPIFIEISSRSTDQEEKISWHRFLRHGVHHTERLAIFSFPRHICCNKANNIRMPYGCTVKANAVQLKLCSRLQNPHSNFPTDGDFIIIIRYKLV